MSVSRCHMCHAVNANGYTCPRCHVAFCSVDCYQHKSHNSCSEAFYKAAVLDELDLRRAEDARDNAKLIRTLHQPLGEDRDDDEDQDSQLDSDDDEDLSSRLECVDLDDVEAVWSRLTPAERREFESMVESNAIESLVPQFEPWWNCKDVLTRIPRIESKSDLPSLKTVMKASPSPCVKFGLVNVLFAYAYAVRFHRENDIMGDRDEGKQLVQYKKFAQLCLDLSTNLSVNQTFDSAEMALKMPEMLLEEKPQWAVSDLFVSLVRSDVQVLLSGGAKIEKDAYVKAALSDLRRKVDIVSKDKSDEKLRKVCKGVVRKIDFYLQWINEYFFLHI